MTQNVTSELILEHLKAIQNRLGVMDGRMSNIEADMRSLKSHMAGFTAFPGPVGFYT